MNNLNYLVGHILYQMFKIILNISLKNMEKDCDNPSIRTYINNIYVLILVLILQNRITFKIKTGYYLELLTTETMKLLGSTKNKITKDEIVENVPHLEITELVLVHCNIVNNDHQQDSKVLIHFFLIHHLVNYWIFHPKILYFKKLLFQNFHILKYGLLIKILNL